MQNLIKISRKNKYFYILPLYSFILFNVMDNKIYFYVNVNYGFSFEYFLLKLWKFYLLLFTKDLKERNWYRNFFPIMWQEMHFIVRLFSTV